MTTPNRRYTWNLRSRMIISAHNHFTTSKLKWSHGHLAYFGAVVVQYTLSRKPSVTPNNNFETLESIRSKTEAPTFSSAERTPKHFAGIRLVKTLCVCCCDASRTITNSTQHIHGPQLCFRLHGVRGCLPISRHHPCGAGARTGPWRVGSATKIPTHQDYII